MFIKFNEEAQKILKKSKNEMIKLRHAFVGSEHLLLSILSTNNMVNNKLNEYGINYDIFKNELIKLIGIGESENKYFIYTPLLKRVLEQAIIDTKESNNSEVTIESIFLSILDEGEGVAIRVLTNLGVNIDELYEEMNKKTVIKKNNKKMLINDCAEDLTKKAEEGKIDPLIGREKEVNEMIEILLRRNKNNPLLIGEAGVGKTAIVEELASRIVKGNVPDKLKNCKIYSLSMASAVAGTKYRGEFEDKITKIIKELENNDRLIVFIDEVHTLVGAGGAEGAIDASNILKPALARGTIKLIGATTIKEYKETISKDKALNRRFQEVFIKENTIDETKSILYNLKSIYEDYHNVTITNELIDHLVMLADKYIKDKNNPDKSIDILDMVCTRVSLNKDNSHLKLDKLQNELKEIKRSKNNLIINHSFNEAAIFKDREMKLESKVNHLALMMQNKKRKVITINDVANVIELKSKVPVYEVNKDTGKLLKLEKYLKEKVIGQEAVIESLSKITKKIMLGFKKDLPFSLLFAGSSGVGKTMLVKEYSNYLNIPLIRLDMSEFREPHSVSKIIGSPPGYIGYDDNDNVLEKVKNQPFSIILLDEIEKACSQVINLFLQILDEGIINDSHGNKVSFKNTIIIMTSNIGFNKDNIGFNERENNNAELNNVLSTPFVNRINKVLYFNCLKKDDVLEIIKNRIKNIKKKYKEYNVKINLDNKSIEKIIHDGEYNKYGARKIISLLEDKIDDLVINEILKGNCEILIKNL